MRKYDINLHLENSFEFSFLMATLWRLLTITSSLILAVIYRSVCWILVFQIRRGSGTHDYPIQQHVHLQFIFGRVVVRLRRLHLTITDCIQATQYLITLVPSLCNSTRFQIVAHYLFAVRVCQRFSRLNDSSSPNLRPLGTLKRCWCWTLFSLLEFREKSLRS